MQEFYYGHPEFKCKLNAIFNSSFPGSVLWDLTSRNVNMVINSWSRSVKYMWNLPNQTHRYFIEPLGGTHVKTMLFTRFIKFLQSIKACGKPAPVYLLEKIKKNTMTITGKNIRHIAIDSNDFNILDHNPQNLKNKIKFAEETEMSWKVNLVKELTDVKQKRMTCGMRNEITIGVGDDLFLSNQEIDDIISDVVTS